MLCYVIVAGGLMDRSSSQSRDEEVATQRWKVSLKLCLRLELIACWDAMSEQISSNRSSLTVALPFSHQDREKVLRQKMKAEASATVASIHCDNESAAWLPCGAPCD